MAGSVALIVSEPVEKPVSAFKDQWKVSFARFVVYPSLPSTCSSLIPIRNKRRRSPSRGTWISSTSPTATLQLSDYHSISDAILSVTFDDHVLEEHYVSKLHFTWPQVSCLSGFPPRGSRAVFASYRDSLGEFQKFAFRFTLVSEAETFINYLKDLLNDSTETTPLNSEVQSGISSQSMFLSTNRSPSRVREEESMLMSPIIRNSDLLPLNLSNEVEGDSCTNKTGPSHHSEGEFTASPSNFASFSADCNETMLNNEVEEVSCNEETAPAPAYNQEGISTALPPSFASFLANCYQPDLKQAKAQASSSDDNDLKSEIARLMEDSSFQEMLSKVEKVINEIGDDLML